MTGDNARAHELIRRHLAFDKTAMGELYDMYAKRLKGHIAGMLRRDAKAVEDVCQDTWIRAIRSLSSLRPEGDFRAWLFQIATNLVRDEIERDKKRPKPLGAAGRSPGDGDAPTRLNPADSSPSVPALAQKSAELELAERLLDLLTFEERKAWLLRVQQGLSFTDIAVVVDCSEHEAKRRVRQAQLRIDEAMGRGPGQE